MVVPEGKQVKGQRCSLAAGHCPSALSFALLNLDDCMSEWLGPGD